MPKKNPWSQGARNGAARRQVREAVTRAPQAPPTAGKEAAPPVYAGASKIRPTSNLVPNLKILTGARAPLRVPSSSQRGSALPLRDTLEGANLNWP